MWVILLVEKYMSHWSSATIGIIIAIVIKMGIMLSKFTLPSTIQSTALPISTVVYSDNRTLPAAHAIASTTSGICPFI